MFDESSSSSFDSRCTKCHRVLSGASSPSMSKRSPSQARFQDLCKCGVPLVERTSWTDMNPGRRFISCYKKKVSSRMSFHLILYLKLFRFWVVWFFLSVSLKEVAIAFSGLTLKFMPDQKKSFLDSLGGLTISNLRTIWWQMMMKRIRGK